MNETESPTESPTEVRALFRRRPSPLVPERAHERAGGGRCIEAAH